MDIAEFDDLKKKVEKSKKAVSRAEGILQEKMERLKEDYNCDTVQEAEDKLAGLEVEVVKLQGEFDTKSEKFMDKWGEQLDEI